MDKIEDLQTEVETKSEEFTRWVLDMNRRIELARDNEIMRAIRSLSQRLSVIEERLPDPEAD